MSVRDQPQKLILVKNWIGFPSKWASGGWVVNAICNERSLNLVMDGSIFSSVAQSWIQNGPFQVILNRSASPNPSFLNNFSWETGGGGSFLQATQTLFGKNITGTLEIGAHALMFSSVFVSVYHRHPILGAESTTPVTLLESSTLRQGLDVCQRQLRKHLKT